MKCHVFKVTGVLTLLVLFSIPADASPVAIGEAYTIAFRAETCYGCSWPSNLPNVSIEGFLNVVPATGTFWDPWYQDYFRSALMVTGIDGTLSVDCMGVAGCEGDGFYSLSFLEANPMGDGWSAPLGDGSYLWPNLTPRYVVFSAEGSGLDTRMINDQAYNLFQWGSPITKYGTQVPIRWSAVRVPEPSSLSFFAAGLVGVTLLKSKQRRRS